MRIDQLVEKVKAAEEKVEKCKKTIERHRAQMEKKAKQLREMGIEPETADERVLAQDRSEKGREAYWLLSDYNGKKDDIKNATSKLQDAERICSGWKEKLDLEINKEKVINDNAPQVIKDFLEDWKKKAFAWHVKRYDDFLDFRKRLRAEERSARLEALATLPELDKERERCAKIFDGKEPDDSYLLNLWPRKPVEAFLTERLLDHKNIQKRLGNFGNQVIFKMLDYRNPEDRLAFLNAVLEEEKKQKLLDLISSITSITGPIADAKYLYVSENGDLNGVIFGENGVGKVQSFSAGGWNVQCFHYRTRVDDVTEKYKDDPAFIKSNERLCTYQFPRLTGGDNDVARDYGLEIVDNSGDTTVKGQFRDILAFADQYLGYQLVPEYLKDVVADLAAEKPALDDVIHSCENMSNKTAGIIITKKDVGKDR